MQITCPENPQILGAHRSIPLRLSHKTLTSITLLFVQVIIFCVSSILTFLHNSASRFLLLGLHRSQPSCVVSNFYAFLMPKRKAKKNTKQSVASQLNNSQSNVDTHDLPEENTYTGQEVERQIAAIRAIGDVEIESIRTKIRLLKSRISKEQLETPLLKYFEENHPNIMVSRTEKNGPIKVKRKDRDGNLSMNTADGENMVSYFIQHMSLANPECSTAIPSLGGFDFSIRGKTSLTGADSIHMKDFVLDELSDTHIIGIEESMQTPGVSSARLSVGMTPKTKRLPKQGEILLSVHGSPLGVYKENNMDAIHETEEE